MVAIARLRREHRIILAVIEAAEQEARRITRRGTFDAATVGGFMEFFRGFTHGVHQSREEHCLFVGVQKRIASAAQVQLVPLLRAHGESRRRLHAIRDLLLPSIEGDYWAALSLADHVSGYCELLRSHMDDEETVLFPLAEAVLCPPDERCLAQQFAAFEREVGIDVIWKYRRLARGLARSALPTNEIEYREISSLHFG